jgi:nicotinamidase-related amidase
VSTNLALMGLAIEAVNRLFQVVLAEDCTAGGDVEGHEAQLRLHFPLLATVTTSEAIAAEVASKRWTT